MFGATLSADEEQRTVLDLTVIRYPSIAHYDAALQVDAAYWQQSEEVVEWFQWRWFGLVALTNPKAHFGTLLGGTIPVVYDGHGQLLAVVTQEQALLMALLGGK